jgi:hypothetical protein
MFRVVLQCVISFVPHRLSLIFLRIDILHIERRQRRSPHRYLVYAFVINTSVLPFHLQSFLVAAHLSSVFGSSPANYIFLQLNRSTFRVAGDFLITLSTAYFLLQSRKEALPPFVFLPLIQGSYITSSITGQPVSSTLSCALLSKQQRQLQCGMPFLRTSSTFINVSCSAMMNLVFSQIYKGENKLISTAFNQGLAKLYAFSMMWTLNARSELRRNFNHGNSSSAGSSGHRVSAVRNLVSLLISHDAQFRQRRSLLPVLVKLFWMYVHAFIIFFNT